MDKAEQKALRKRCRHKAEIPLFLLETVILLAVIGLIVYYGLIAEDDPAAVEHLARLIGTDAQTLEPIIGLRGVAAAVILALFVWKCFCTTMLDIGKAYRSEIPVSDKQYPFIADIYHEYARKLGIKEQRDMFVASSGMVQYDTCTLYNIYLLRIAPMLAASYDPRDKNLLLRFRIAQYVSALFMGYSNVLLFAVSIGVKWIPFLNDLHAKAMCYTIDRVVQVLMGEEDALNGCVLAMNETGVKRSLNCEAYVRDIEREIPFICRVYGFFTDLGSDEPLPIHRIAAMKDPKKKSGRLL